MKKLHILLMLITIFWSCEENEIEIENDCSIIATVVDLTGLDGCGLLLELENGDRLEPVWRWGWCGTPPLPEGAEEDPMLNFELYAGQIVTIDYEPSDMASICMAGLPVIITCIQEVSQEATQTNQ